jgi:hypothetical protein
VCALIERVGAVEHSVSCGGGLPACKFRLEGQPDACQSARTETIVYTCRIACRFMVGQGITPDSRRPVRFVDDEELAYVAQRYREIHDFIHVVLGMDSISVHDEIAVKW